MSVNTLTTAIAQSVLTLLRSDLSLSADDSDLRPNGRPSPYAGEWFYSVHSPTTQRGDFHQDCLETINGISVTITFRGTSYPTDRQGQEITFIDDYLTDQSRKVRELIHLNYELLGNINGMLPAGADPALTPLEYLGGDDEPQPVGPDWFYSIDNAPDENVPAGHKLQLVFGNMERLESTGNFV